MAERYRIKFRDEDIDLSKMSTDDKKQLAKTAKDEDILRQLSKDEDYWVRRILASNPNATADVLRKLSTEEDINIRENVAENPNTPVDVLRKLAEDNFDYVRYIAKKNPTFKKYVKSLNLNKLDEIDYMTYKDKQELAETTKDVEILKKLSEDKNYSVRSAVAENENTPADILRKLSDDYYYYVRRVLAKNSNTPIDILVKFSNSEDKDLRLAVASNPNCPKDILKKIKKYRNNKSFKVTNVESDYSPGNPAIRVEFKVGNEKGEINVNGTSPTWEETEYLAQSYADATGKDFEEVNTNYLNYKTDWEDQGFMYEFDNVMEELGIGDEETRDSLLEKIDKAVEKEITKSWSYDKDLVTDFIKWCRKNNYIKDSKFRDRDIQFITIYKLKNNKKECGLDILFFDGTPYSTKIKLTELEDYVKDLQKTSSKFHIDDPDNIYYSIGGK